MSKVVKVKAPDGTIIKVEGPDDATDEQFIQQGAALYQQRKAKPEPPPYESPRWEHTNSPILAGAQVASDQVANVLKGIPQAITGIPGMVGQGASALVQILTGGGTGKMQEMVKGAAQPLVTALRGAGALAAPNSVQGPSDEEWAQAAQGSGAMLGSTLLGEGMSRTAGAIKNAIPSTTRAGANFQTVMGAAKNEPLDLTAADKVITRADQLRNAGSTFPKVFRDYVKNRQSGNPMTYETGRDFASNAGGLSSREATALNSQMHRQISMFTEAMKTANRDAAVRVGMGDVYDAAMKEYRQAKTLSGAADIASKWAKRAALGAVLGGGARAGYDIIEKVMP